eukprot:Skav219739  [mRNA]  locus=scaffold301:486082:486288:- [translate_table: standard]
MDYVGRENQKLNMAMRMWIVDSPRTARLHWSAKTEAEGVAMRIWMLGKAENDKQKASEQETAAKDLPF